jgi:hypothetical protein
MNKVKIFRRDSLFALEDVINKFAKEKEIMSVSTGVLPDNSPYAFYATVLYKDDKVYENSQAPTNCNHQFEPANEGGSYTSLDGSCKTYTVYRCKYCGETKKVY